jgi:hypothetical protein
VKTYVGAAEELRQKERQGETQKTIKIHALLSFTSPSTLMFFFEGFFGSRPVYDQTQCTGAVFSG